MPVQADPQKDQVEAVPDLEIVAAAVLVEIGSVRVQEMKRVRRQIDRSDQVAHDRMLRAAGIVRRQIAELVQDEHRGLRERGLARGDAPHHPRVDRVGGQAAGQADLEPRVGPQPVSPERRHAVRPRGFGVESKQVHRWAQIPATDRQAWRFWPPRTATGLSARCGPSGTRRTSTRGPRGRLRP